MKMRLKSACTLVLLVVAVSQYSQAIHNLVGMEPQITNEQQDVVISNVTADGSNANLVLNCETSGDPAPIVSWFRGGEPVDPEYVLDNGTLFVANLTEGEFATVGGVVYYCTATNTIGDPAYNATVRSRDITVTYAFFGGFGPSDNPVFVPTAPNNIVDIAVECLVLDSQPPPLIEWFRTVSGVTTQLSDGGIGGSPRILEGGRFLYVRDVGAAPNTFPAEYHCEVANARLYDREVGTRYIVNGSGLMDGEIHEYKEIGDLTAFVGEELTFSYVAAQGLGDLLCVFFVDDGQAGVQSSIGIATWDEVQLALDDSSVRTLSCRSGDGMTTFNAGTVTIYQQLAISSPPPNDREVIVGEGSETFSCASAGLPTPTVQWYYNGQLAVGTPGVTISSDTLSLTLDAPQVSNSGMYQCFVSNGVQEVSASWAIEVREPVSPTAREFNLTAIDAVDDRQVGALLVRDLLSEVTVTVLVDADPCPLVQWSFNGTAISDGEDYTIPNPCAGASSPFTFTLTVTNLTSERSGPYSATFTNLDGSGDLPRLYITVPVVSDTPVGEVTLDVLGDDVAQCLLNASDVTITCNTDGFPRPDVQFTRSGSVIMPGVAPFTRYTALFDDQLLITNVDMTDEAAYICSTVDGTLSSPQVEFDFCTKPVLDRSDTSPDNVFDGDELIVECEFSGTPPPTVQWLKDDRDLEENDNIEIITPSSNPDISRVVVSKATEDNGGVYTCIGTNDAGSVSSMILVTVNPSRFGDLTLEQIIGIAAGGAGAILLVVLVILLLVCVYMCARNSRKKEYNMPYNVSSGKSYTDYSADARGNVDKDSDEEDGGQPEAFNPEYESLPALRPTQPPTYKPTPSYPHGGPIAGDDIEMVKVPPPDTDSFVDAGPPYRRDNGVPEYGRPGPDDFLSEDAQFV